jgi:hypothetical protein
LEGFALSIQFGFAAHLRAFDILEFPHSSYDVVSTAHQTEAMGARSTGNSVQLNIRFQAYFALTEFLLKR